MNLEAQLTALKHQSSALTLPERAKLSCRLAKHLEKAGEYEIACEALNEFWPDRSGPLKLDGLDEPTKAEVLLRVGALAGWQGSADQTEGSQEAAKDLITQSIEIFEELEQSARAAEARGDLALCYWREGSYDEARIHLANALSCLANEHTELKAVLLIRAGMVEVLGRRLVEALPFFDQAAPLLESSTDHALKGTFHNHLAVLFNNLGTAERREDYIDRALIEYAAASFHFEQAGHSRYQACVDINVGFLFFTLGRFAEAHQHLDSARSLFLDIRDNVHLAQVNDTSARTFIAEGRLTEAERFARAAVKTLEKGGEQGLLGEALTTHGIALARLGRNTQARSALHRAIEVAETAGDLEGAGRAKLSMLEELGDHISLKDLVPIYRSAIDLLKGSQDPFAAKRLISSANKLLDTLGRLEGENQQSREHTWEGFSFTEYVRAGERAVIERALRDASGSVTRAARLLDMSHQSLIYLINSRHKELLKTRSTVRKRRRHIFSEPRKIKKKVVSAATRRAVSQISVLHVEDNELVARVIAETLTTAGMHVDSCMSGSTALKILKGDPHYDMIIVDNDLPGLSGLDLVLRTRKIAHRHATPIIMLSGDDCEREAWRVGVNAFLRKPEDVDKVSLTIDRLLEERK